MPVDSSIYGTIQPPQPMNIGGLLGAASQAQDFQARNALQGIIQQSTDPATHEINPTKMQQLAPQAGVKAPEIISHALNYQQQQQAVAQQKMQNIQARKMLIGQELYSHIGDPDLSGSTLHDSMMKFVGHPAFADVDYGAPEVVKMDQELRDPKTGGYLPQSQLRQKMAQWYIKNLTPEQASEYVKVGVNADGSDRYMPRAASIVDYASQFANNPGRAPPPHAGAAAGPAGAPSTAQPARVPGQTAGSAMPSARFSNPPGFAERQAGAAATDNQLAGALSHEAEGSPQRRALLGNIIDLTDKFKPGPGAAQSKEVKAFINRNVPLPEGWKFDQKSIADQEEFEKQAAQFAQKQFDTIGGTGTDAKFHSAFTTSPNSALSAMGNKAIGRLLLGNEDAITAKNRDFLSASANNPSLSYRQHSAEFNSRFDPRAFQFKYIPANERQAYVDKMDPDDKARFLHDLTYARKRGWVNFEAPK